MPQWVIEKELKNIQAKQRKKLTDGLNQVSGTRLQGMVAALSSMNSTSSLSSSSSKEDTTGSVKKKCQRQGEDEQGAPPTKQPKMMTLTQEELNTALHAAYLKGMAEQGDKQSSHCPKSILVDTKKGLKAKNDQESHNPGLVRGREHTRTVYS